MRVPSSRQKVLSDGSVGYFHPLDGFLMPTQYVKHAAKAVKRFVDCEAMLAQWQAVFGNSSLLHLATKLGVSRRSLELVGCTKSPQSSVWGFPMRNSIGAVVGIRMRHENGAKWTAPGTSNGLFIPQVEVPSEIAICEGPTDTAASLTIGLYAIGRFNNCGGVTEIADFIKRNKVRRAFIIADCDDDRVLAGRVTNPGISGAMNLAQALPIPTLTVALPCKDMRKFVNSGGELTTFHAITDQLVWNNPK